MNKKVLLMGEMGEKFGKEWNVSYSSIRDLFQLIDCQRDGFRQYLLDSHTKGIGFTIKKGEEFLSEEELLLNNIVDKDTLVITPVPAGAGGLGKILAAVALLAMIVLGPAAVIAGVGQALSTVGGAIVQGAQAVGSAVSTAAGNVANFFGGGSSVLEGTKLTNSIGETIANATTTQTGNETVHIAKTLAKPASKGLSAGMKNVLISAGTNLAMTAISQFLAKDPSGSTSSEGYLFNGAENTSKEGQAVPILYGELIVGGSPINLGFTTTKLAISGGTDGVTNNPVGIDWCNEDLSVDGNQLTAYEKACQATDYVSETGFNTTTTDYTTDESTTGDPAKGTYTVNGQGAAQERFTKSKAADVTDQQSSKAMKWVTTGGIP